MSLGDCKIASYSFLLYKMSKDIVGCGDTVAVAMWALIFFSLEIFVVSRRSQSFLYIRLDCAEPGVGLAGPCGSLPTREIL